MDPAAVATGVAHSPVEIPDFVEAAYGIEDARIELLTGGRTNRTLRVRAGRDVVLQQLHGDIHGDLLGIMENLVRVTSHLGWKQALATESPSWYPELIPTEQGKPFLMTAEGDVWRAFSYRAGVILRSSQPLATLASAAAIFGRFAAETADLGGPDLIRTAPGFHDLDRVHAAFVADFAAAPAERRAAVEPLIETLDATRAALERRCADDGLGAVPDRVVHNDTKLSNVLFDRDHGRATAVLDLDLVMMGPAWHDLGDLVRSSCWHAPAAQIPASSPTLFDAVVGGFVAAAGPTVSAAEVATFAVAGPRLSFELGLRYLSDHLRDEPHLMVPGVNGHLVRGRSNVNLAREMLEAYDALRPIVDALIENPSRPTQGST